MESQFSSVVQHVCAGGYHGHGDHGAAHGKWGHPAATAGVLDGVAGKLQASQSVLPDGKI